MEVLRVAIRRVAQGLTVGAAWLTSDIVSDPVRVAINGCQDLAIATCTFFFFLSVEGWRSQHKRAIRWSVRHRRRSASYVALCRTVFVRISTKRVRLVPYLVLREKCAGHGRRDERHKRVWVEISRNQPALCGRRRALSVVVGSTCSM